MNLYDLLVFVHVAAAVLLVGSSVMASPGVRAAIRRARTTEEMRAYAALARQLLVVEPAAAVMVLASGAYLTSVANFWGQGWVQAAIASWLVNATLAAAIVKPTISNVAAAAAVFDGPVGPHLDALRWSRRWSFGSDALMANDAAMLYLMTMKPGLAGSVLAIIGFNVVVAAVRASRHGLRYRGRRVTAVSASVG